MNNIKLGDTSPQVNDLQVKLKGLGYGIKSDSNFGQNTLGALHSFQKLNGLPETDFVDENTYNLIVSDLNNNSLVDKPSLPKIMSLHPKIRFEVLHLFKELLKKNLKIRIVQGFRTFAEQDELYAQGRTKPGSIVTNARGGFSNHCYGLSIDFCILHNDGSISWSLSEDANHDGNADWMQVVGLFKSHGYDWGGDWKFKDNPHIEKTFGLSVRQLLNLYNAFHLDDDGYVTI